MALRMLIYNVRRPRERIYRQHDLDDSLDDEDLRSRYRFGGDGINFITNIVSEDILRATRRGHALSPELQVKIALRYYASGTFFSVIGDTVGVSKSSVSRSVHAVSSSLVKQARNFIKWPDTPDQKARIQDGFYQMAGFPSVIGAIDCTHVRLQAPSEHEYAFVNRKGFHSINVQAICDDQGKFTNVVAEWPGSCHDSYIFQNSAIGRRMEDHHRGFDLDGVLLGDSGYPCKPYLLTPYLHTNSREQERFNIAHRGTRVLVEQTFGWLKRRFHCLHGELRVAPDRACKIIIACFVLHNIVLSFGEPMDDDVRDDDTDNNDDQGQCHGDETGRTVRDHITRSHFT